ncbi:restriction endonuclease subunit S [Clavibacter michiganensis]|uniref:restriction endonuclease subunit S n=1 Tax=Clavibacter michiganensis TaxID=28447 RepID=UPI000B587063|nr:restriction endonuclease subunit S [Clavibacter michiganensis]OUD85998.1 Restriction enzyme BgcI subunit beta [Clavibacter michiganensis subsp. michiganensis]
MIDIDTSEWGEFKLADLFERIESGKCSNVGALMDGETPYVAASTANNGFVRKVNDGGKLNSEGNCIALICDGNGGLGRNTYQADRFVASSNLQLAYHSQLNQWNALFLVACLDKSTERYNYNYAWKRRGEAFSAETVFVPITSTGTPDWQHMERVMRSTMKTQNRQFDLLEAAAGSSGRAMNISGWGDFLLTDLFDVDMGSGLDFGKMQPTSGDDDETAAVAFVGRTGMNNGVMGIVRRIEGAKLYEAGAITVALGGSIGACFVQQRSFHTSQNVAVLHAKTDIKDSAKLFVATAIKKESSLNYKAFVKELNAHLRRDFSIKLPVLVDGTPDWTYMQRWMKSISREREAALVDLNELVTARGA